MAEYTVLVDSLTEVVNAEIVRKGALEGRTVPPVYKDHGKGATVELADEDAERLLEAGAIAAPGGDSGDGLSSLKKGELEDLADEHDVDLSDASNNDERIAALREAGVSADSSD